MIHCPECRNNIISIKEDNLEIICSICLEIKNNDILCYKLFPCSHYIHKECLNNYSKIKEEHNEEIKIDNNLIFAKEQYLDTIQELNNLKYTIYLEKNNLNDLKIEQIFILNDMNIKSIEIISKIKNDKYINKYILNHINNINIINDNIHNDYLENYELIILNSNIFKEILLILNNNYINIKKLCNNFLKIYKKFYDNFNNNEKIINDKKKFILNLEYEHEGIENNIIIYTIHLNDIYNQKKNILKNELEKKKTLYLINNKEIPIELINQINSIKYYSLFDKE